jgi:hypothetical protein
LFFDDPAEQEHWQHTKLFFSQLYSIRIRLKNNFFSCAVLVECEDVGGMLLNLVLSIWGLGMHMCTTAVVLHAVAAVANGQSPPDAVIETCGLRLTKPYHGVRDFMEEYGWRLRGYGQPFKILESTCDLNTKVPYLRFWDEVIFNQASS